MHSPVSPPAHKDSRTRLGPDARPDSGPRPRTKTLRPAFCVALVFGLALPSVVCARAPVAAAPAAVSPARAAQEVMEAGVLGRGGAAERELKGGERHSYRVALARGQFMRAVVEQRGINLVFTLSGPDGNLLAEVNNSHIPQGAESLFHVAESSGDYRLEMRAWERDAPAGHYEVRVAEVREATVQDRTRAAAERLCEEARRLQTQGPLAELWRARNEKLEAALPLWRAAGDGQGEAETLALIGWNHYRMADYPKASEALEQALPLRRAAGDRSGEGDLIYRLGIVHLHWGDRQKALEQFNGALALYRAAGNKQGEADVFSSFGWFYWSWEEEYQKALESFSRCLALSRSVGYRPGEGGALYGLGLVYWGLGEYQKSLEAYGKALAYQRAVGDRHGETGVLDNMGLVYHALGEYQKALECYAQSLPYRRAAGLRAREADTLTGIGTVYASMDENQKALEHLNEALPIYREVGNRTGESYALRNIGFVYTALKEPHQAVGYLAQALALDRELGERSSEARALAGLARARRDLGDLAEARSDIEAALDIIESLRSRLASQDLRASFFASRRSYYEFYIDLLMRLDARRPGAGHDAAALQASERARARSLLDLLAEAKVDVSDSIDPDLSKRERAVRDAISRLNGQTIQALAQPAPDKDRVALLRDGLRKAEAEREQLEVEIRARHPRYAELKYPTPLAVTAIQGLLGGDVALLEYTLGPDTSYLFVVTREGLRSYRLPPAAEINRLVKDVRSALSQPGRREFGRYVHAAERLYETLVAPAAGALKDKRKLLIAPDGALYYLPFEVLLTARPGAARAGGYGELAYLLKRWAVGYVPSASVLASLRRSRPEAERGVAGASTKEFVAFADPVYAQRGQKAQARENRTAQVVRGLFDEEGRLELQQLKDSAREAAGIAKAYKAGEAVIYLGGEAKEENVKANEHLSTARRIHFAAHGLISERAPQYSGLVLTLDEDAREDGLLQVYEIYNLKLTADLVVLSACRTGLGREVRGEGVIGLSRAFLYAGASSVVVSLWQVADQSTPELMIQFYGQMRGANGKAEALRAAKLKMIEDGRYAHPYYWAPFVLTGEPN